MRSAREARTAPAQIRPESAASSRNPPVRTVWLALATVYLVWGSTYLAIRVAVRGLPPFISAGTRFVVAGLLLAAVVAIRRGPRALRATRRQLLSAAVVGLLLLLGGNGFVVLAETSLPSGLTALLVAAVPLWVVLLRTLLGDRAPARAYLGVLLGLAGLLVLLAPGMGGTVRIAGLLAVGLAGLLWSVGSVASSRLPMPANPFTASAYEMLAGGLGCLLTGLFRGEQRGLDLSAVGTASWLALAYLVVFGSLIAFSAYVWLLHRVPVATAATYAYVNPVVAVLLGWLILGEPVGWSTLAGGAVAIAGVWLVLTGTSRSRP